MTQDVRKTLVVLSQIRTALETGMSRPKAIALALESPQVSGFFHDKLVKRVIDESSQGNRYSVVLAKLDIFSEYDQALLQSSEDYCDLSGAIDLIINQHMFIRSLGV
jgi:type II secretory pathway component PulF